MYMYEMYEFIRKPALYGYKCHTDDIHYRSYTLPDVIQMICRSLYPAFTLGCKLYPLELCFPLTAKLEVVSSSFYDFHLVSYVTARTGRFREVLIERLKKDMLCGSLDGAIRSHGL